MTAPPIDIPALAKDLLAVDGLFDQRDADVVLALYRLLAEGKPVSQQRLAARAGRSVREIAEWLRGADRAEFDDTGAVVAFQGFTLRPTQHLVEVDDRTFYAGCAVDTLFIPEAIGHAARVRSTDPFTGETVSLSLDADGSVRELEPAIAVQSMAVPDTAIEAVAIPAACGPINFFGSPESGHEFTTRVKGTFLLTIEQGVELARLINHTAFGAALARPTPDPAVYHCDLEVTAMTNTARKSELAQLDELVRSADMGSDASRLVLRITRMLAHGRPISDDQVDAVTDELGIDKAQALKHLTAYAERDDNGDIIGAAPGITLNPTPHRFTTDTAQVWAWCIGDTMILPAVLNQQARVETTSPKSKEVIRFTVGPHGVSDVEPAGAVSSFPGPVPGANPSDGRHLPVELSEVTAVEEIWSALCHQGHNFGSLAEAQEWVAGRDDIMILSLSEVFDVMRGFTDTLLAHETGQRSA